MPFLKLLKMNNLFSCLSFGIIGCLLFPSLTLAKQPVVSAIGNIQNRKEVQGAGCTLHRKGKQQNIVFWSAFEKSALMNINGKDHRLQLVSETPSLNREKKGDRSTAIYKSGKIVVRIEWRREFVVRGMWSVKLLATRVR
jgi:hypothetical protein